LSGPDGDPDKPAARILLVEAHDDARHVMSRLLAREGYHVQAVANVRSALELGSKGRFDLLLADVGLPDGEAWGLLQKLRQEFWLNNLKGISMTGHSGDHLRERSAAAGFSSHHIKPLELERLLQSIREVLKED